MSFAMSRRNARPAAAVAAGVLAAGFMSAALPTAAFAASNFSSTFTGYTVAGAAAQTVRMPALLAKQVVILTGTNFSEDNIATIDLGPDAACANAPYVVVNATTISVKTPSSGCAATTGGNLTGGDSVVINEVSNLAALSKAGLFFVAPPEVATTNPVVTETSALQASGDQVTKLLPAGGQLIRITASHTFIFDSKLTGTNALSATLGGKALTAITGYKADGTALTAAGQGDVDDYFTALTPVSLVADLLSPAASNTYALVISQSGVSKSFATSVTHLTWPPVPTVTTVVTTIGVPGKSGDTLKITGTGFSTATSDVGVTICGITAPIVGTTTATIITVTAPVVTKLSPGLGASTTDGPCPVRVTNVLATLVSPITAGSNYVYVINRAP